MTDFAKLSLILLSGLLSPLANAQELRIGGVYQCAKFPPFVKSLGMSEALAIDTTVTRLPGVVLRELDGQRRLYQGNSWGVTGSVGSTVRDQFGNIYVIPVPSIGLDTNPLERRNKVYKISAKTGIMAEFVDLPLPAENAQSNPFGTLGLAIDCETNSLYVSSVAGSTAANIVGTIYRISLASRKVVDQFSGVDAIGIGIFNFVDGKRLYYGDARSSSVFSLALTRDGQFLKSDKPRYELSLLALKNGDSTQVKKIVFTQSRDKKHRMTLSDTEFAFRMQAETNRQFRHYEFVLDQQKKTWVFEKIRG